MVLLGNIVKRRHANREKMEKLAARLKKLEMPALDQGVIMEDEMDVKDLLQDGLDDLFSSED